MDIKTFDVYVLNYHYFIALSKEVVEKKVDDPRRTLTRLTKYASEYARKLIKHCIQLPSNERFKHAKYLLEKVYGNPHKILASYRKEVKNWQPVNFGHAIAFRQFHNFLLRCKSVATNQRWNTLDTPDILCMLISKLPSGVMERWNKEVLKIRRQQHREPNLEDFTKYVEDKAILMSDTLFSRQTLSGYLSKPERSLREDRRKKKAANYRVQSDESQIKKGENVDRSKSSKEKESCVLRNGSHDLDECKAYNDMEVKKRSKFLNKQKLYYGCYEEISSTHTARNCPKRRECKICLEKHPTGLHGFKFSSEKTDRNKSSIDDDKQ